MSAHLAANNYEPVIAIIWAKAPGCIGVVFAGIFKKKKVESEGYKGWEQLPVLLILWSCIVLYIARSRVVAVAVRKSWEVTFGPLTSLYM